MSAPGYVAPISFAELLVAIRDRHRVIIARDRATAETADTSDRRDHADAEGSATK